MSRKKLFLENFFVYGFFGAIDKIIPFVMLPIITRILVSPDNFAVYSVYTLIVGFGGTFFTLGIYDAMFREYFIDDDAVYRKNVLKTATILILSSSIIFSVLGVLLSSPITSLFFSDSNFNLITILALFTVFLNAMRVPFMAPIRLENKRKEYILTNIFNSFIIHLLGILLIIAGYKYYGLIYSTLVASGLLLIYFLAFHYKHQKGGHFRKAIALSLLMVGLPLVPNLLIYWVYDSFDKVMISSMLGTYEMGIYSVAAKFSKISQLFHIAFAGGWQYFAFSTMKDSDQTQLNSRIFEVFLYVVFAISSVFLLVYEYAFKLLFDGQYFLGLESIPFLFVSPLFLVLFQISGNQFIVIKKSYLVVLVLFLGSITNVMLNLLLIPTLGITGAAIATFLGYLITVIVTLVLVYSMKLMHLSKRVVLLFVFGFIYFGLLIIFKAQSFVVNFWSLISVIILGAFLFSHEVKWAAQKILGFIRKE